VGKVTFDRRNKTTRAGEATWRLRRPTTIYGVALWWTAQLAPGVQLSTGPLGRARTGSSSISLRCRRSPLQPGKPSPPACAPPRRSTRATNVTWTLTVNDGRGRELLRQALDLEKGYLP